MRSRSTGKVEVKRFADISPRVLYKVIPIYKEKDFDAARVFVDEKTLSRGLLVQRIYKNKGNINQLANEGGKGKKFGA